MRRRWLLLFALLALIVPVLAAGCGGDGDEGGTTPAEEGTEDPGPSP